MKVKSINLKEVVMQEEEVVDVRWASIDEIKNLIKTKEFSNRHAEFFEYCMNFIEK